MWYIEFIDTWFTTDASKVLYTWDLLAESKDRTIKQKFFGDGIMDIIPLDILRLLGISTLDKKIFLWNYFNNQCLASINLS